MKSMKKIFSLVLALALTLSLSTVAFAENGSYTDMSTVTVSKTYKLTNTGTTSPAETFTFSALTCTKVENAGVGVTAENAPVPTIGNVSYNAGEAGSGTATKDITITLPTYTAVGEYWYTFTETDSGTAGVTYRSEAITLKVTVIEQNGKIRVAAVHTENDGETKSGAFDNTYSAGSLAVKKVVEGIMGDQDKEFTVTVTFTAPEGDTVKSDITYVDGTETKHVTFADGATTASAEITLKHNETITFNNIPYNVTYTVVETDYSSDGYTTTYAFDDGNKTINTASENVTITNTKGGTVDTGIMLDSLPYILMLIVVAAALVLFFGKKRYAKN